MRLTSCQLQKSENVNPGNEGHMPGLGVQEGGSPNQASLETFSRGALMAEDSGGLMSPPCSPGPQEPARAHSSIVVLSLCPFGDSGGVLWRRISRDTGT